MVDDLQVAKVIAKRKTTDFTGCVAFGDDFSLTGQRVLKSLTRRLCTQTGFLSFGFV